MTDLTIGERLIVVETQLADDIADGLRREAKQDEILKELVNIKSSMALVAADLAKYRSWFGGALFILTCVGTFLYRFGTPIINFISKLKSGS